MERFGEDFEVSRIGEKAMRRDTFKFITPLHSTVTQRRANSETVPRPSLLS